MSGGNESLDPRQIPIAPMSGLNALKLFLQYQALMLRIWANNCELAAHNVDRSLETFRSAPELGSAPEHGREAAPSPSERKRPRRGRPVPQNLVLDATQRNPS